MSNSVAEAYLLIVRESNVPIIGEAVPVPFTGQIELDAWSWDLKNNEHYGTYEDRWNKADADKKAPRRRRRRRQGRAAAKHAPTTRSSRRLPSSPRP